MPRLIRPFLVLFLVLTAGASASAQLQSPWEFLGYEAGERFTPHHRIVDYLEYLDRESELLTLESYGTTWEGRPLLLAVIGSQRNMGDLPRIKAGLQTLADPRKTSPEQARDLADRLPAVVWLAFGVHGNESSSAEAAMVTAHWLLSGAASETLEDVVVLIDPLENPDGRERYVNWFHQKLGSRPNPSPAAIEHNEPWPGGRYNHYLVDMNRDWAWASQPETRGRIGIFETWHPQVVVDLHEMFYDSTYFFPPSAAPINLNIDPRVTSWLETFGRANAAEFSERGWPFFVREHFDLFYPGYGDSWPSLRGAIGMTYEVAGHGRGGLIVEREDQTTLSLAERIEQHSTAAITTVRTAAANHEQLLLHTWSAASTAMRDPKTFFLLPESPAFDDAVSLLQTQGIELTFLGEPATVRATKIGTGETAQKRFPTGTAVVTTAQPLGGFAKAVLEQNPTLPPEFVREQRERVDEDEYAEFYDLTGWSIPLAFNVEAWEAPGSIRPAGARPERVSITPEFRTSPYGWIVDGLDPAVYRTAAALHRGGVRFGVIPDAFEIDGKTWARGSLAILRYKNVERLEEALREIARAQGARFTPVDRGWVGEISLGSDSIEIFLDPQILLLGGEGTYPTSFGTLWYTLDVTVDMPHTVVDLEDLGRLRLGDYRVIVMPDGYGYSRHIQGELEKRLESWVREGGTLVAIKGAAAALRGEDGALSEVGERTAEGEGDQETEPGAKRYTEFQIPGAAFATEVRRRDHLTFGLPAQNPAVLVEGGDALELAPYAAANVVTISESTPLIAGLAWPESIETVAGSPWLTHERIGRGRIITFADDPHYRLFWKGTLPYFLNAVMYTPSFTN